MDVTIGDESASDNAINRRKERPIWMMESTVVNTDGSQVYRGWVETLALYFDQLKKILYNLFS